MLDPQFFDLPATPDIKPAEPRSIVSIAAYTGTLAQLRTTLNANLPLTPTSITTNTTTYLWSGDQTWLAMSNDPTLESTLRAAAGTFAAITDQSDGRTIFTITAANPRPLLAKLLPIDLHESAFPPAATALTLAGHVPIQIWRTATGQFELSCFRSYAHSLYHALTEAAA